MKTKTKPKPKAKRVAAKKRATKKQDKQTQVVFVLDRTGSMAGCIEEAINGFNVYVKGMRDKDPDDRIRFTLVQFDSSSIDTLYRSVPLTEVADRNKDNYLPGSTTPLYDAVGHTIRHTEERCKNQDVLFVTLTDGLENASHEWNKMTLTELIKQKEKAGWTFVHIGTGIQGWKGAIALASGTQSANNVLKTDAANLVGSLRRAGGQSVGYVYASSVTKAKLSKDFFGGKKDDTK